MVVCPIIHEIVGHLGSLYFTGIELDSNSLMFEARKTFLGIFVFLFLVHMSFRNLAYVGTC